MTRRDDIVADHGLNVDAHLLGGARGVVGQVVTDSTTRSMPWGLSRCIRGVFDGTLEALSHEDQDARREDPD
jgi:hypothetical protein